MSGLADIVGMQDLSFDEAVERVMGALGYSRDEAVEMVSQMRGLTPGCIRGGQAIR